MKLLKLEFLCKIGQNVIFLYVNLIICFVKYLEATLAVSWIVFILNAINILRSWIISMAV